MHKLTWTALVVLTSTAAAEPPKPAAPARHRDAHFVDSDDYCVGKYDYDPVLTSRDCELAKLVAAADATGKATFAYDDGTRVESAHYWRTHIPKPGELRVGMRICFFPASFLPDGREAAVLASWRLSRIAALDEKTRVSVIGVQDIDAARVRVVDGPDPWPPITVTSRPDAHFFHPEYLLVWTDPPDKKIEEYAVGLLLRAPTGKDELGEYVLLDRGSIEKAKRVLRSRPLAPADAKVGARVAFQVTYAPDSREHALSNNWYVGTITEVTTGSGGSLEIGVDGKPAELARLRRVFGP